MKTRQPDPSASHLGQLLVCENSSVALICRIISGARLTFVTATVLGRLDAPSATDPNRGDVSLNVTDCENALPPTSSAIMNGTAILAVPDIT